MYNYQYFTTVKSKPVGSKRNRIILIYILGVVLPGLVLGFMAFRGIRSDEALREKQTRQELSLVSQDFFQLMISELSDLSFIEKYASISLEQEESLKIMQDKLLFLPDEFLKDSQENDFGLAPDRGWELEFMDKNLSAAESYYLNLIKKGLEKNQDLKASMALARIQRKQKKHTDALATYQKIIDEFQLEKLGQLPAALASRLEKAQIFLQENDTLQLKNEWLKISQELLHPQLNYSYQAFDIFYQEIINNQNYLNNPDSILALFKKKLARTHFLNKFLKQADDYLHSPNDQIIYLAKNEYQDLLVIHPIDSTKKKALLIDMDILIQARFDSLCMLVDEDNMYNWMVKDETGNIAFDKTISESESYYSFPFPAPLSGWQLNLRVNPRAFLPSLFESGKGLYALIFGLLAIWLLLGLVFTVYMLNQEIRLSRMKSRFISNVSHEFKSPVTSIRHMSELMKLKRVRTEEKKEEFYDSMIDQCDHLGHLIENIMDFSKIEDEIKKYHFEPIMPDEIVGNLVGIHKNRLSESGIEVNYSVSGDIPKVLADKDAISQVLYNLLDNAYKYASIGKKIDVILSKENQEILNEVRDYGPGIPMEEQNKIFDRFYRIDEKKNEGIKGSGIGLTLVKKIVESHQGRIKIISKPGEGSSFRVYLPLKQNQEL